MSAFNQAETFLFAWRPGGANEPLLEKARRAAGDDPALKRRLEQQHALDLQITRAIQAIAPPEGLRARVCGGGADAEKRPQFAMAMYLAACCGLAVIIALGVFTTLEHRAIFPGKEAVVRMVSSAKETNVLELQPVANPAGDLADWFFVRGFDGYSLPDDLAKAPALAARIFKQDKNSVAEVAVEWHNAIFYLFRADAFGVDVPPGEWRRFQVDDWRVALRKEGNNGTVVALHGSEADLEDVLHHSK